MLFHRIGARHRLTNNDATPPSDPYVMIWLRALLDQGNTPSDDALGRVTAIVSALRAGGVWNSVYRCWVFGLDDTVQATLDIKALQVALPETGTPFIPGMGFAADTQAHWISLNCYATEPDAGYQPDSNSFTAYTTQRPGQPAPTFPGAYSSVRLAPDSVRGWHNGTPTGPVITTSPPLAMNPAGLGFTTGANWIQPGAPLPLIPTVQSCAIIAGSMTDDAVAILHAALNANAVRP
jgi:hypothetical protein